MPGRQRLRRGDGLARLYREAPLNSIWEGSGNVKALDVLRRLPREPASVDRPRQGARPVPRPRPGARRRHRRVRVRLGPRARPGRAVGRPAPRRALALTLQAACSCATPRPGGRGLRRDPAGGRPRRHVRHPRGVGRVGCRVAAPRARPGRLSRGRPGQSATTRAWGAASFIRVVSQDSWAEVSFSYQVTTPRNSSSRTAFAAWPTSVQAMSSWRRSGRGRGGRAADPARPRVPGSHPRGGGRALRAVLAVSIEERRQRLRWASHCAANRSQRWTMSTSWAWTRRPGGRSRRGRIGHVEQSEVSGEVHGSCPPRRRGRRRAGAGDGRLPGPSLVTRTAAPLKAGCFDTGSHAVMVSSLAARVGRPSRSSAVVERDEDDARPDAADAGRPSMAPRGDSTRTRSPSAMPSASASSGRRSRPRRRARPPSSSGARPVLVRVWKW